MLVGLEQFALVKGFDESEHVGVTESHVVVLNCFNQNNACIGTVLLFFLRYIRHCRNKSGGR